MKKEVDALRRLRHPRLVRFIGACVQPPLLLVVTEPSGGELLGSHGRGGVLGRWCFARGFGGYAGVEVWDIGVWDSSLVLWLEPGYLFHPPFGDRPCFGWRV